MATFFSKSGLRSKENQLSSQPKNRHAFLLFWREKNAHCACCSRRKKEEKEGNCLLAPSFARSKGPTQGTHSHKKEKKKNAIREGVKPKRNCPCRRGKTWWKYRRRRSLSFPSSLFVEKEGKNALGLRNRVKVFFWGGGGLMTTGAQLLPVAPKKESRGKFSCGCCHPPYAICHFLERGTIIIFEFSFARVGENVGFCSACGTRHMGIVGGMENSVSIWREISNHPSPVLLGKYYKFALFLP